MVSHTVECVAWHLPTTMVSQVDLEQSAFDNAVSGLSVTRGRPGSRQHVWTFVIADNDIQPM